MSDKMREAFERWAKSECIDTDSVDGFYSDNDTHIAWGSWQAAQSAAVPVVGDVLYWIDPDDDANIVRTRRVGWSPLYGQPTTSITAAELAALRENLASAERERDGLRTALQHACIGLAHASEANPLYQKNYEACEKALMAIAQGQTK